MLSSDRRPVWPPAPCSGTTKIPEEPLFRMTRLQLMMNNQVMAAIRTLNHDDRLRVLFRPRKATDNMYIKFTYYIRQRGSPIASSQKKGRRRARS
jgi:hypothetical protein